jgi:broad specificity phosphatase PhoE
MSMPNDLVLVRHGRSLLNELRKKPDEVTGVYPEDITHIPESRWLLTAEGETQARNAGEWISQEIQNSFDRKCLSEYVRALQTAAEIEPFLDST